MIMDDRFKMRTGHLITHWGVPHDIYPRRDLLNEPLAVIEFAPRKKGDYWRYVTNGMSEHLQGADHGVRTELVAYSAHSHKWVIDTLDALARYPFVHNTFFSEWDTVSFEQPIDRGTSAFTGVVFCPIPPIESKTVSAMGGLFQETVYLLAVAGLSDKELRLTKKGGEKVLRELVNQEGILIDHSPRSKK